MMKLEWSAAAVADLDRFAEFLHDRDPAMARRIAAEIIAKARIIEAHPLLGRPIEGRAEFRQFVLRAANATYALRYGYDGERLVILRIFHGREKRD
jgi:plasmid stabilization system protein ParE